MPFIRYLADWAFQAPRILFATNVSVFTILLFVYRSLVTPTENLNDYVLPNKGEITFIEAVKEKPPEAKNTQQLFDSFFTTNPLESVEKVKAPLPSITYVIKSGDTLARIFSRLNLSKESMYAVLEADQEYLVLDPLQLDDKYIFTIDENGDLAKLTRIIDISKSVSYVKHDNGGFSYEELIKPVTYTQTAVHSEIVGSLYLSAQKVGLSNANVSIIYEVLKGRVDFRKDLREGDPFDLILKRGSIDGVQVGEDQLEALQMTVQGVTYRAFLHTDGRFYDKDGKSLTPSLRRWPTYKEYRISSSFNNKRLHPITGRPAPHNGVDLATPIGTKILATGDGVVTRVANHRYAGRYIVMDYAGPYGARFLHLSKILVKKGQKVKRGQVIALSGNTGRTTGAHLHYELHVRGRPVNPMTTKIPTTKSISNDSKEEYNKDVANWIAMMSRANPVVQDGLPITSNED